MRAPRTYVIFDTHWYCNGVIKNNGRPTDHTEICIRNLQHQLKPQDILIHGGDVIHGGHRNKLKDILDSIPGTKVLVRGNHDPDSIFWYMRNGFSFACDRLEIYDCLITHEAQTEYQGKQIAGHWHNNGKDRWNPEFLKIYNPKLHYIFVLEEYFKARVLTDILSTFI